jgi:hypothetical protein
MPERQCIGGPFVLVLLRLSNFYGARELYGQTVSTRSFEASEM